MSKKKEYEIRSGSITRSNPESRTVCGYAVRFDTDSVDMGFTEKIMPGAITEETIQRSDVLALLNHDEQKVLARCKNGNGSMKLEIREEGLYYEFDAPNTIYGDELLEQLSRGDISQSSFAFTVSTEEGANKWYRDANGNSRRDIYKIDRLFDCSPVYFPAYELTTVSRRSLEALSEEAEKVKDELNNEVLAVQEEVKDLKDQVEEIKDTVEEAAAEEEKPAEAEETAPAEEPTEEPSEEPKKDDAEEASTEEETPTEEPETEPSEEPEETPDNQEQNPEKDDEEDEINTKNNEDKNKRSINIDMKKNNKFSLLKAIRSAAYNTEQDAITSAILEAGREEMRGSGFTTDGQIQLPAEERAITVTTEHDDVVEVEWQSLIKPLFENKVLGNAKKITGVKGDIKYPYISKTNPGAAWEGEIDQNTESTNTFSSILLQPHRLSTTVYVSKQFLMQESVGAEQAIRELLLESLAQKLEKTFLGKAAASGNVPAGLFYGKTATPVTNFAALCDFEAQAVENCYDLNGMKYLLDPKSWATIRGTFTYGGKNTRMVMENDNIDGRAYDISQNFGAKEFALIDWNSVVLAQFGGLDLSVDATSVQMARTAQVAITINSWFDCKLLRNDAVLLGTVQAANNPG
jgi:HK97 family phage prohead protease/HK97 family phage major capsid protein